MIICLFSYSLLLVIIVRIYIIKLCYTSCYKSPSKFSVKIHFFFKLKIHWH